MPLIRKRRAPTADDEASEASQENTPAAATQRQRRRPSPASEAGDFADGDEDTQGDATLEQMVKKLVRFALACEYARQPIRRADISAKVLGTHGRQFKAVFQEAQLQLRATFGMEMTELPLKEKVTLQQRRAAQKTEKAATSSNAWVLTSTLPSKFKTPAILPPPRIPTSATESAYVALYTFIISVIYLAGGQLPEEKLERYLKRTNADQTTPVDKTDKLLNRLIKEGYIVRNKDTSGGEEIMEYMVGPRGKVEVGEQGVAGLVRTVYGEGATEELEKRIERSLGLGERNRVVAATATANGTPAEGRGRGRPRRGDDDG
ncbi:hypothetical protein H2201_001718 [Coniosporium apollinis]|uniref:MAGE domain-containing protein n=2 Tax=Coniosporium TaxID=2810619 RepID=A0ABQ9P5Y4_9PEZI|nr:hypothetical protein H2199_007610 [Cladosporium sp. JES 115]KAJ9668288.1 hypothetical protein H2201_001718 [Coniosporium apollinis]